MEGKEEGGGVRREREGRRRIMIARFPRSGASVASRPTSLPPLPPALGKHLLSVSSVPGAVTAALMDGAAAVQSFSVNEETRVVRRALFA